MAAEAPRAPLSVYMLADHLDAALAAGEDLIARGHDWRKLVEAPGNMQSFHSRQRTLVDEMRAFELMAIARILKARDHARALANADQRFAAVANLFASGTAVLMDAVEECGDATDGDFDTGDAILAYVRSRGLIPPEAASVGDAAHLTIDDSFLIAKRATLGALMDMASTFLDALETHYDLFVTDDAAADEEVDGHEDGADETDQADEADEAIAAPAPGPATVAPSELAKASSPISRMSSRLYPRKEFGQRHRSPLN